MSTEVAVLEEPCPKCGDMVKLTPARVKHGRYQCNRCSNEQVAAWVEANKERALRQSNMRTRRWQKANPDKMPTKQEKKSYDRQYFIKKKYGLTLEQYDAILLSQNYQCALCRGLAGGRHNVFHIDHDHITGKIRGLLCAGCNLGLGSLGESVEMLQMAINYIKGNNHE